MSIGAWALLLGITGILALVAGRIAMQAYQGRGPLVRRELLMEPPPDGYAEMLAGGVPVKGVSFGGRQRRLKAFARGQQRLLSTQRQPGNRHDTNAIQILGAWQDMAGQQHGPVDLGWVPRELAADIVAAGKDSDLAATLTCIFHARWPAFHGLRIALWAPVGDKSSHEQTFPKA